MNQLQRRLITFNLSLAFFIEILDATALNTSLPQIAYSFHINPVFLRMAIISYLLSVGLFLPLSSYFADRIGTQRLFIFANCIFLLGSIVCACSTSIQMLTAARVLQGIGGAFLGPMARLIMVKLYPADELMKGQSTAASIASIALLSGPLIGGALTHYFGWRYIFIINIPIAIFSITVAIRKMPNFTEQHLRPFDMIGYILIALSLACFLFFCDSIADPRFAIAYKLSLLAIAIACTTLFILHSRKQIHPFIAKEIWALRSMMRLLTASFSARLATSAIPFLLPLILQTGYGYSALHAGYAMVFMPLGFFFAKFLLVRMKDLATSQTTLLISILMSIITLSLLSNIAWHLNWWLLAPTLIIFGFFLSIFVSSINVYIYSNAPAKLTSQITMINSSVIQLSASFAVAIASAYLIHLVGIQALEKSHLPLWPFHYIFLFECGFLLLAALIVLINNYKNKATH